ncbi:hypothetical protein [Sphingomonas sp.]|uniref:hypothetical protein n=1 Tax=Sphingomonas sp. TaxID=28214 RepID=UPI0031D51C80
MRRAAKTVFLAGGLVMAATAASAVTPTPDKARSVAVRGITHIVSGAVGVTLATRPATPPENGPPHATRCSGGWVDCSLVDSLTITIDGKGVIIPDRAVVLLSDVVTARVEPIDSSHYKLTLVGGDAGAAYEARLFFDRHMVRRMEIWSPEMRMIEQTTRYHDIAEELPRQ